MAIGEKVRGIAVVPANGWYYIRPTVGLEWTVHNVYHSGGGVDLLVDNGSFNVPFRTNAGMKGYFSQLFHSVTNAQYLVVRNYNNFPVNVAYDGVQTK